MNQQDQIRETQVPEIPFPPRRSVFIDLPLREGEVIVSIQPYRTESKKPRKWQFWAKEKVKVNFGVLTNAHRFFIVDPDAVTLEEKPN